MNGSEKLTMHREAIRSPLQCSRIYFRAALFLALSFACPDSGWSKDVSSPSETPPKSASLPLETLQIAGWNRYSRRHIDPPVFELVASRGATKYVALITGHDGERLTVESAEPRLDLSGIWSKLSHGSFQLGFEAHVSQRVIGRSQRTSRVKAWDWQGYDGKTMDWPAAADRNIAFLIDTAEHGVAPYREPGVPVWVWSSAGPEPEKGNPKGRGDAYPAAQMPYFIWAFLAHAEARRPQPQEALRLARACGDWLLGHRHSDTGKLPLFPYSTIGGGKFEGGQDGKAVNLMRASDTAAGLVDLYRVTEQPDYLDYAAHIADVTMKFQRHDGGFPYRVDPASGQIVEDYTCRAIDFVKLVDALEPYRPDARRAFAARRAVDWMLAYPVMTSHWQGAFEDVGEKLPFENLENAAALQLIRYLCRHRAENPAYVPIARKLNRWVEDQFVIFKPDETIGHLQVPVPQVIEQYACWKVMETHTANWIEALIALHEATAEAQYLEKAQAAANAICASQFANGEFSTWGHDPATGKRGELHSNWYVCNARASQVLYELSGYVTALNSERR
jgi:hypothetical protein